MSVCVCKVSRYLTNIGSMVLSGGRYQTLEACDVANKVVLHKLVSFKVREKLAKRL